MSNQAVVLPHVHPFAEKVANLIGKLASDPQMGENWLDAALPHLADFLYCGGPGLNAKVIVRDEDFKVLKEIGPANSRAKHQEETLIRSADGRYRHASADTTDLMALLRCLADRMSDGNPYRGKAEDLLYALYCFTTSEENCPEVAKTVKKILGE